MTKAVLTKFPFISLTKSLERARSLYNSDLGNRGMSVPIAFAAWDYSEKSSGGFQTISALKQYGLVRDEGNNDDRKVKLTDQARRYFASEISSDKEKYEADFAIFPAVMKHLAEHWDYGCPPDNVARTYLKNDLGLNEQSARSLLGIYKENQRYIGLNDSSLEQEPNEQSGSGENADNGQIQPQDQRNDAPPADPMSFMGSNLKSEETDRDIFSVSEGEVVLISPKSLSAASLEDISDWLDIMKRKLARKLKSGS
jgi:hypothetical protein